MTRLPSHKTPHPSATDPRLALDGDDLAEASTNAYPVVAGQFARRDRAGLLFGAGIAMLLGAVTLFGLTVSRSAATAPRGTASEAAAVASALPAGTAATMGAVPPLAQPVLAPTPAAAGLTVPPVPPVMMPPAVPGAEVPRAPALVFDAPGVGEGAGGAPVAAAPSVETPRPAPRAMPEGLTPDEQFVRRLAGEGTSASATPMAAPGETVAQGTLIAAVLETGINSDLPGYVRAVISREVRSFDGRKVLIPRGSHVIGEYKSGLAVGQTRAFVLWTRLLRPDGVSVALGSPATDTAGSNGLPGKVNSHFGKRFGAAILMSLISAGGQAIGGGGAVIIAAPSQAASTAAQRDIMIPPTVRVAAGTPIRIFVARDLDFSGFDGK